MITLKTLLTAFEMDLAQSGMANEYACSLQVCV